MKRFLPWIERLTKISPIPAWSETYVVLLMWIAAIAGYQPAADFWSANAASIAGFCLSSRALWYGAKIAKWHFGNGASDASIEVDKG